MLKFDSLREKYKMPFGAVAVGQTVQITFPVNKRLNPKGVFIVLRGVYEARLNLPLRGEDEDGYLNYCAAFSIAKSGLCFYRFEVETDEGLVFVGRGARGKAVVGDWLPEWQLTVYDSAYGTPDWLKGGIIYHIFPDRFARIEDDKKPKFGYLKHWDRDITIADNDGVYRANDFFGGNIKGIISKLDYLKELSVTAIYLSPVFEASSNHRYDTGDYMKIDGLFGTEEEFKTLIEQCDKRGIGVILDGVFNHTGSDSVYFNKHGHYDSLGAYQSKDSPYYDWYTFTDFPDEYAAWWGVKVVPTVRRDSEGFHKLIAGLGGVIDKWTSFGVKGWRLDVVDELSQSFVKQIRQAVKRNGADNVLIGEVWEDASTKVSYGEPREYLFGSELDGVMNYPFRTAILDYLRSCDAQSFIDAVYTICENYPKCALDVCMTLIGTHDTVRVINELSGAVPPETKEGRRLYRLTDDELSIAKQRLKLAAVLQYVLPGVPSVYYGDEQAMQGFEDPINRRPFEESEDGDTFCFYRKLGQIRAANKADFTAKTDLFAMGKGVALRRGTIMAIINPQTKPLLLKYHVEDMLSGARMSFLPPLTAVIFRIKSWWNDADCERE